MKDVKLDIYDASGKLVQSVPGTKRKGINKVYWNLRWTPPKTATGGTKVDYGGFVAPMVLPGTYTLKLKVGDKEYTKPLQLVHDNTNKLFSEADRKEQYDAAMKLYQMHESLYSLVNKINAEQKTIKSNLDSVIKPQSKKMLKEYDAKLEDLRSTHNTLYSVLRMSTFNSENLNDGVINLEFAFPFHQKRMSDSKNQQVILEKLSERGYNGFEIVCMVNNNRAKDIDEPKSFSVAAVESSQVNEASGGFNNIKDIFGSVEVLE